MDMRRGKGAMATKILQVSPGYFPAIGGVEEHVREISAPKKK